MQEFILNMGLLLVLLAGLLLSGLALVSLPGDSLANELVTFVLVVIGGRCSCTNHRVACGAAAPGGNYAPLV
jgi:hypothetical protein